MHNFRVLSAHFFHLHFLLLHLSLLKWLLWFPSQDVCITTGDLVGSSQVLFEAAFVISAILFSTKSPVDINSIFGFNWISLYITLLLTTKIKFTLSSVFICIEFWPVNHTSVRKNSKGNLSVYIWFVGEIFSSWSNELSQTKVHKTIELCWYWLLT